MITLDEILASTRARVAASRTSAPPPSSPAPPRRDFRARLADCASEVAVIAEIKRRSPSRGAIRPQLDVAELAMAYERAGAAALSVLTEPRYFDGSMEDLRRAKTACGLPVLRKDFIVDEWQLDEADRHGADAVLLIAAALDDEAIARLARAARDRGLAVLLEVHDGAEIDRARAVAPTLIGVNNRNLTTMRVDANRVLELAPMLPKEALWVAESGLRSAADLHAARQAGYRAFLIGEYLLEQPEPGAALSRLRDEARAWSA